MRNCLAIAFAFCLFASAPAHANDGVPAASAYEQIITADAPIGWWRFDRREADGTVTDVSGNGLHAAPTGTISFEAAGPRPSEFPDFDPANAAASFAKGANYLLVTDPAADSPLDFKNGDALTIEAWLRWDRDHVGFPYILGKGRSRTGEGTHHNQNYALRIVSHRHGGQLSFLFCDAETPVTGDDIDPDGHRWTSEDTVPDDGAWHHIAVTYEFGRPDSICGYIDGEHTVGKWDMGVATDKPPVVDDDLLWIGSSQNGKSTFVGDLDEVALYRTALSAIQIQRHANIAFAAARFALGKVPEGSAPDDHVRMQVMAAVPRDRSWNFRLAEPSFLADQDCFAFTELPRDYNAQGLIVDRPTPWLVQLASRITLPAGDYELSLRSLDAARVYLDDKLLTEVRFMDTVSDGHEPLYQIPETPDDVLSIPAAHNEASVTFSLDGAPHVFTLYRLVGTKSNGPRIGELAVGIRLAGEAWHFLAPARTVPFTDAGWSQLVVEERIQRRAQNRERRAIAGADERNYWHRRHELARQHAPAAVAVPDTATEEDVFNDIDRFIAAGLVEAGERPRPLVDDFSFLRRLWLDLTGVIPPPEEIDRYLADAPESRRAAAIERALADEGWADHWVGYWQDVLAENPGLTKPEINNTGPFRWFLHESFADNKPFDRFVTELVMMEGSRQAGGPAGFAMASQNDAPFAAKAHILGEAFLAVEMKCARCHDAPYHSVKQADLFALAAMLQREAQEVPGTSVLPEGSASRSVIKVSLHPGDKIEPQWPFATFGERRGASPPVSDESTSTATAQETANQIPDGVLRRDGDTRELLAAQLTLPTNGRFARVTVNRLWQRYMGRGLVEPVDDWENAQPSHPELLDYLASELVTHDYDLKHVARLIVSSHVYQRMAIPEATRDAEAAARFAGPVRRRLTGEQLADSLARAVGKPLESEELTMDNDGRRPDNVFLDLGTPQRAWEFAAVSNERDRPSMTLPAAQGLVDLMMAFGWRQQRQDPVTLRDESITPLAPLVMANGAALSRAVDFTERGGLTALALEDQPLETLIERLHARVLSRPPTSDEREELTTLLTEGYAERIVAGPEAVPPLRLHRSPRTWTNHLDPAATDEALARIAAIEAGDAPTVRLAPDWRARAEDAAWALLNHPEFLFVP